MEASSLTNRLNSGMVVKAWPWWRLPYLLRWYVAVPPLAVLAAIGVGAGETHWHALDVAKFFLLLCCGIISVASTPRIAYANTGMTRDFITVWVLPAAILLPPEYALLIPIPLLALIQWWVHRGVVYRRVFSAATISLGYGAASLVFRAFPASFAGGTVGSGVHALTWAVAVLVCELVGGRSHHLLLVIAIKMADPTAKLSDMEWNREALQGDFAEIDLAVLITAVLAISPVLAFFAVPSVLLVRRFMMHAQLVAQSRIDAKTGLLNVSTWEREAEGELSRAARTRSPVAVALIDIDHFKLVNDTHGHLVGDRVLRAVGDVLNSQLRGYDRAGRFGGEEFVLLLAQTDESDARRIAERLRIHIAGMAVPVSDSPGAASVRLTISIGVTGVDGSCDCELTDLLAAADSALYKAKQTGRNKIAIAPIAREVDLDVGLNGHVRVPQADPTATLPCPTKSLLTPDVRRLGRDGGGLEGVLAGRGFCCVRWRGHHRRLGAEPFQPGVAAVVAGGLARRHCRGAGGP
jgi:diguanylate cyclase (GGDEF)-like protein